MWVAILMFFAGVAGIAYNIKALFASVATKQYSSSQHVRFFFIYAISSQKRLLIPLNTYSAVQIQFLRHSLGQVAKRTRYFYC